MLFFIIRWKIIVGGSSLNYWNWYYSNKIVSDDTWHFICAVYENGDKGTLYIDGQLDKQVSIYYAVGDWNTIIGRHQFKDQNYFNSKIDDLRIYNKALSAM